MQNWRREKMLGLLENKLFRANRTTFRYFVALPKCCPDNFVITTSIRGSHKNYVKILDLVL